MAEPPNSMPVPAEDLDVLVVGAGISGIAAGHYLRQQCPQERFLIIEARERLGGTWDLFRYPGIRSDSDMFTMGYSFRPWTSDRSISPGPEIRAYLQDTVAAEGLQPLIRLQHRLLRAAWCSAQARWTLSLATPQGEQTWRCRFLFMCSGYYDYAQGHAPTWPGMADFRGRVVHPQHWPEDLDYSGQQVVVIGSGATAVTLVPAMAARAAHVTLLQRSPTYMVARPLRDGLAGRLQRWLPAAWAHRLLRTRNILMGMAFYQLSRRRPAVVRRLLRGGLRQALGRDFDLDTHFSPRYNPWDQRLCLVPDGDLFHTLRDGRASIVTDQIECFTATGLRLASGRELPADLVVSATGLQLQMLGGVPLLVDGQAVNPADTRLYQGVMLSGVPNLALSLGYVNASWTLRAELACRYVCRLLNALRQQQQDWCRPDVGGSQDGGDKPLLDLSSGYVQRAAGLLPRQGGARPWRVVQNYLVDALQMRLGRLRDGVLRFGHRGPAPATLPGFPGLPVAPQPSSAEQGKPI